MLWDGEFIEKIIKAIIDAMKPIIGKWIKPSDIRAIKIFMFAVFVVLFVLFADKQLDL